METSENPKTPQEHAENPEQKYKKARHRKKQLYARIRSQIEFYFSDSNLSKDRFLSEKTKENNGEVDINIFLTFNKIKTLTESEKDLVNAVSNSELLELSEDQTKIKRKIPYNPKSQDEIDACTIYVENIPVIDKISHDWVRNLFEKYGKVNYVSLPKYNKSGKFKGFGFVEFDSQEAVQKALEVYQSFSGVLMYNMIEAEKLMSISTFQKEQEEEKDLGKEKEKSSSENVLKKEEDSDEPPTKKLRTESPKKSDTEEEVSKEFETVPVAIKKGDEKDDETKESATEGQTEDATSETEGEGEGEPKEGEEATEVPKKKKRKHKKKNTPKIPFGFQDEKIYEIKIMQKKDWKKMRNTYLDMERKKAKEIKKILRENRKNQSKVATSQKNSPKKPMTTSPGNMNFYGSPKHVEAKESTQDSKTKGLVFEPGLIVNIKFREPVVDVKELKTELKQYSYVKYIDVKEGDFECFVRVDAAPSAQELIDQYSSCEYTGTDILKDEVEKNYWNKINSQRENKHNKKDSTSTKIKRKRGREKLLNKITKAAEHIRFGDTEEELAE